MAYPGVFKGQFIGLDAKHFNTLNSEAFHKKKLNSRCYVTAYLPG